LKFIAHNPFLILFNSGDEKMLLHSPLNHDQFARLFSADSAFTERILGVPGENYKGYVEADATQRAQNVPSHSMYLLHGLADITAPYQHGVALARALAEAGIIFRYQVRVA
jgi:dipeptidyl aminopeptidase/acylaminoacyl peptidase